MTTTTKALTTVKDRYEVSGEIGRGAMGIVYRAVDGQLGRDVAIKVLANDLNEDDDARTVFEAEARALAQVNHPNVVSVYDVFAEEGRMYMVMEFVSGFPVSDMIHRSQGQLDITDATDVALQLLAALAHLQDKEIVHRDIKPSNIMVDEKGMLRLMDFGLARSMEKILNKGTNVRGTPAFMAPEQVLGEELSPATDLYCAGVTFFELFTKRLPFESGEVAFHHVYSEPPDPREFRADLPDAIADTIMACLAKKPKDRPLSARSLLKSWASQIPGRTRPFPRSVVSELDLTPMSLTGSVGAVSGPLTQTATSAPHDILPTRKKSGMRWGLMVGVGVGVGVVLAAVASLVMVMADMGMTEQPPESAAASNGAPGGEVDEPSADDESAANQIAVNDDEPNTDEPTDEAIEQTPDDDEASDDADNGQTDGGDDDTVAAADSDDSASNDDPKAARRAARLKAAREKAAREAEAQRQREAEAKARAEREAAEREAAEKAAREKAAREKAEKEKAAAKAAKEKAAREKAAREKAAREKAAREKAAREKAAKKDKGDKKEAVPLGF